VVRERERERIAKMRNVHDGIKKGNAGAEKKGNGLTAEEATDNSKINFS